MKFVSNIFVNELNVKILITVANSDASGKQSFNFGFAYFCNYTHSFVIVLVSLGLAYEECIHHYCT